MKISANKILPSVCVIAAAALFALSLGPIASGQAPKRLVTQSVDESKRVMLQGNVHPWARAEFDQGAMADAQPVNRIYLLLNRGAQQQAALDKLMLEQVDKNSPNYHKWLTPEQYGTQFGPSDEDVQTVKSWLSAQGFTEVKVNAGKTIVEFNGTVGSVRKAFATDLHRFVVRGEQHFANVSNPQIPAALAPVVLGIPSLHNFRKQSHIKRFGKFRRDLTTGEIRPLFTYTDGNGTFFGMGPADFAKIYNIPAGADGSGQSIAIVARSNINIQDVIDFRNMFGLTPANNVTVILNGADPGLVSGDEGEADLDVEWSGAVAPKATIKFVVSESEQTDAVDGVDASAAYIVDNNIAPVMSESFGSCEAANGTAGNAFQNALWQQAAAEGITVSVSAGDNGSAGCDDPNSVSSASLGIAVSGTASTPFNVAVGGTDFDDATTQSTFWDSANTSTTTPVPASAKGYIPEVPWNDSCAATGLSGCTTATASTNLTLVAGSGGPSAVYSKSQAPFQTGFGDTQRDIPDISLFAADGLNKSFYIVCESDEDIPGDTGCNLTKEVQTANCNPCHDFQAVGGTSASAPAFAAIMALVNQKTGQRQGNANFVLYALAKTEQALATFPSCNSNGFSAPGTQASFCVFMDITKGNNAVPCVGGKPNCSKTSSGGNGVLEANNAPAFTAAAGYDLATGLGSINVSALLTKWTTAIATGTTTTTTLGPPSVTGTAGAVSVNLTGNVTGSGGTPTGVIIIENAVSGAPLASTIVESNGAFSISASMLPVGPGTYTAKAHYSGDVTFAPSESPAITIGLGQQTSKVLVSFVTSNNSITQTSQTVAYGSPYILRVDVANNAGNICEIIASGALNFVCPTGSVALKDNGTPLNDFPNAQTAGATNVARLNDRGFIEDHPIQLSAGSHSITAGYTADGTSSYASQSASNTLSVTITQATTTTSVLGSPSSIISGGSVTLTATISSSSNSSLGPTGTVQFANGSANLGAPVTCTPKGAVFDSNGNITTGASCTAQFSTTLSALAPPLSFENRWRPAPFELLAALMAILAIILLLAAMRLRGPRRAYAYGLVALFLVASAALAGCGGGGGGGGGNTGHAVIITGKYSGDTNYTASQGSGTVTVQ